MVRVVLLVLAACTQASGQECRKPTEQDYACLKCCQDSEQGCETQEWSCGRNTTAAWCQGKPWYNQRGLVRRTQCADVPGCGPKCSTCTERAEEELRRQLQVERPGGCVCSEALKATDACFLPRGCGCYCQRLERGRKACPHVVEETTSSRKSSFEGAWELTGLSVGPELGKFPLREKMGGEPVTLRVERRESGEFKFGLSFKFANTLFGTAQIQPTVEGNPYYPFARISLTPLASAKMMGPPGMMEVESRITQGVGQIYKGIVTDDGLLLDGPSIEMSFVRPRVSV